MNRHTGWRLVCKAKLEGARLKLNPEGKILLDVPDTFSPILLAELRENREAIERTLRDEAEEEIVLREWFPNLGAPVVDRETGRSGHIWGASKRGLIVDFGPGAPLITLDPRKVFPSD